MSARKRTRTLDNGNAMASASIVHTTDKVRRTETPVSSSRAGVEHNAKMNYRNELPASNDSTQPYNFTGVNFTTYAPLINNHTKAVLDEVDRVIALMEASTDEIPPATNVAVSIDEELLQVMERPDPNDRYGEAANTSADSSQPSTSQMTDANTSLDTANTSTSRLIDESVILLDDYTPKNNHDDEVIFVGETPAERRITAVVDLCIDTDTDTPERPAARRDRTQAGAFGRHTSMPSLSPDRSSVATAATASTAATVAPAAPAKSPTPVRITPQIQCPICLEDFPLNSMWTTYCGHGFCEPCIRNCIQSRKKCPTCNTKCSIKQIHRLFLQ